MPFSWLIDTVLFVFVYRFIIGVVADNPAAPEHLDNRPLRCPTCVISLGRMRCTGICECPERQDAERDRSAAPGGPRPRRTGMCKCRGRQDAGSDRHYYFPVRYGMWIFLQYSTAGRTVISKLEASYKNCGFSFPPGFFHST